MLPKFLTHLDKQKATHKVTTLSTARRRYWCCTFPLVLLALLLVLLHSDSSNAERDFNFNDSQVPLLEPKDEPILIDHHTSSSSSSSSSFQQQQHHHNHHQQHGHNAEQDPYAVELSHCRYDDNEIVLSLVLKNYNWHDFNDSRKAKVLEKLSQFFAIPKEFITMESVTKHELFEMQKESLKKGNNKCHNNNNRKLGRVNFIIGCGSTYFTVTEPISKQIGQQVKDGALDNITGEKFGWWVIWRKQYKSRSVRNRRQIEGSGDDDEDDDYYDYEEDTDDVDPTTTPTHAHRHHHGDETSEITSNKLDVTINEKDNNIINNNALDNIGHHNKINDDITAMKQTDPNDNEEEEEDDDVEEVEKTDTNLLLLNKKSNIDEEIVESVSQLESVITKTIENTKNLEDIPDIVVDQPVDDILAEVLQPIEEVETASKNNDKLNLNTVYENANDLEADNDNNSNDFNVAEVLDSLTPSTTISSLTTNGGHNTPVGVNVQENLESLSDSTTPFSLTSSHSNKNNHLDVSSSSSPSSSSSTTHGHTHHSSSFGNSDTHHQHSVIEFTTITNSHLTPVILTDTTTTITTPLDSSSNTVSSTITTLSSSSSSSSSSTMLSTVLKKYELSSNSMPNERTYNSNNNYNNKNNNNNHDNNDDEVIAVAEIDEKQHEELEDFSNINNNEDILKPLTNIMTMPTVTTTKSQQMTAITTEQQLEFQQHHRHQYYSSNNNNDDNNIDENSMEIAKTKATTLLTTSSNMEAALATASATTSSSSSYSLDMLAIATTTPTTMASFMLTPSLDILQTPTTTSSSSILELPNENVFEININGKKDETTLEPEDTQDLLGKSSTTTMQSIDESNVSVTTTTSPTTIITTTQSTPAAATPEVVSSTTALPDYVEPKIENSPPMIKSRLQKLAVTSGKSFKLSVPEDTFYDNEDLSNLRLELTDKEGRELKSNSWLQFNAETKEIYGLPLDDAVSKWQYRLTATDSGNESVTETLEISVQQHRGVRTVNHEINISVKINEKNMHYIDWQMSLINAIANTLGDANTNSIVVREIRANPQDPNIATLVYFNETLPTSECPERELNNLVKRLDVSRLSDLVQPTLGIKSLTGQLIGPCQKTAAAKPKTPTLNVKNAPPVPRNQVDRVVATVGHLLVYKVPSDTFFDPNDNELTLSLKTKEHKELSPRHWLQFDSKNDEFYGIPKSGDAGSEEYMLVAEDAGGLTATDALVVQVNHAPKRDFSLYIKVYLAIKHEHFNADLQRKFVERMANLFGDASTQNIQIRSVTTLHDSDGTVVSFYNTTLYKSHNRCPEDEMEAFRSVLFHDYSVRERVKKALGPELNITNIQIIPLGSCNGQTDVTHREFVPSKTDEPLLKSTFSDDYMFTIILPAIIIVSMILIASLIACCDEEERKSFRTKGIPVIFQDELDEKPEIGNKSPIILKDEKPPLLPPSYNTSNMNGDNDVDEYVPPPAVVVGGREARGKSPATPSYRKPPPYVSP
ncbi:Dystroglycan [Lucilia cuprina]|nr:Dystroglycan [Lucilia cuprina]